MSWARRLFVGRVDERKTAWGERNGKKTKSGSSLCGPHYMSCLRNGEEAELPNAAAPQRYQCNFTTGAQSSGSTFGLRYSWQEDHYSQRTADLGLKSLGEDCELKGGEGACDEEDGEEPVEGGCRAVSAADCLRRLAWVFHSKKFRSAKLERLYQRYFFRLNQSSLTMLMGMLVLVCGVMLAFHCVRTLPNPAYVSALAVAMTLFLALMVACNRNGFRQDCVWMVSYLVMGVLAAVQALGALKVQPSSASEGVWWTVFFIYITYTLLPVRMRAAVASGAVLSVIHVATTWHHNQEYKFVFRQVSSGGGEGRGKSGVNCLRCSSHVELKRSR